MRFWRYAMVAAFVSALMAATVGVASPGPRETSAKASASRSDRGPRGPRGPAGPRGPQGPAGATGRTGSAGPTGPTGATGATGLQGAPGQDGKDGAVGLAGPRGPSDAWFRRLGDTTITDSVLVGHLDLPPGTYLLFAGAFVTTNGNAYFGCSLGGTATVVSNWSQVTTNSNVGQIALPPLSGYAEFGQGGGSVEFRCGRDRPSAPSSLADPYISAIQIQTRHP